MLDNYRSGSDISLRNAVALARAGGVTVGWLATGKGPKVSIEKLPVPPGVNPRTVDPMAYDLGDSPDEDDDRYVRIPRYEVQAAAGVGTVGDAEHIRELVRFDAEYLRSQLGVNPASLVLIEAVGDSMAPTIASGDLLLVDVRAPQLRGEGIYVLSVDDTLLVKRVSVRAGGRVVISSDNKAYPPEEIDRRDLGERLRIIGRVVWVGGPV